ncbi:MAG: hypothetical protein PHE32_04065 [Candidatus Shapirobacteria bacterium]|nr:hypothetical protein [Candidatus Shapirobacteria bacterium]
MTKEQKALSYFEKKIKRLAYDRFEKEWQELRGLMINNKLLNKFTISEFKSEGTPCEFPMYNNTFKVWEKYKGTNLEKVIMSRFDEIEAEETKNVFNKLDSLRYLFENQQ